MAENADFGLFEKEEIPRHQFKYQVKRQTLESSAAAQPLQHLNWKSTGTPQRSRTISSNMGGYGGPGMRAVFLDSGQRSSGTGVFLPRRVGTSNSQHSNNPACPPVLLPTRVVQALNLKVHEIGLQIKPQRDSSKQYKNGGCNRNNKTKSDHTSAQDCSPEIFLPKEWTY